MSRFCFPIFITILVACLLPLTTQARDIDLRNTYRLYDGVTAYVNNSEGTDFRIKLDVRDMNIYAYGPREILFKVYDPDGRLAVREVIPDDGIDAKAYLPTGGGWDHEMWYYASCYTRGSEPMLRWSTFSDPARLAGCPKRTFTRSISGGKKGVYRILLVGERDHYVTLNLSPSIKYAVSGSALWLHGHHDMYKKRFIYVPRGTISLHLGFTEYDHPQTRRFTIKTSSDKTLFDGSATGGFAQASVQFGRPGQYDDQILTLDVSDGPGDYMVHVTLCNSQFVNAPYGGGDQVGSAAVLAPDIETAKAAQGGAIYHDGQVFWHMFQVRLYDWLKRIKPEDFEPKDKDGNPAKLVAADYHLQALKLSGLPEREGYFPLAGVMNPPPLCDNIMHSYTLHQNRQALNLAIKDLAEGLRWISNGDHRATPHWNGTLAYLQASYGWQYWRAAWRITQQSDAPKEAKDIVREAFILLGDRLAFAHGIDVCNGNAFSHIPESLKYCSEATGDKLQKRLFEEYFNNFISEGWGPRTGISKSGACQEGYAYDHHYGSYIFYNWAAPIADFGDERFKSVIDRIKELYTYTLCHDAYANPWSSRTAHSLTPDVYKDHHLTPLKNEPGPDFTVSVNGGDEWFAARRKNYYILTYSGRLVPLWLLNTRGTRIGYGGGAICQFTVPGKGTVIASTLNDHYGHGMELYNWRNFHLHSVVGEMIDTRPLVAADIEHNESKLVGTTVTNSGEIRECPVGATRKYTFGADEVTCEVQLTDTSFRGVLGGDESNCELNEAYEMIPFLSPDLKNPTRVSIRNSEGGDKGELATEPIEGKTIVIDRGGYGVRIELEKPAMIKRGSKDTVLIQLVDKPAKAVGIGLKYRLVPFIENPAEH